MSLNSVQFDGSLDGVKAGCPGVAAPTGVMSEVRGPRCSAGRVLPGEEPAEVLDHRGFVRVGDTYAHVSVRSDDEQGVALDPVVPVGVTLVVGEAGDTRLGG